ncbi:MAG: glycosyltransferase [Dehalococcoidales bacterium]|nr:glycosyltransferase [Dehalococcoidales bacterium]
MSRIFKMADDENEGGVDSTWRGGTSTTLYVLVLVGLTLLCIYAIFRGAALFNPGYRLGDRIFAILLLGAESFILIHAVGYFLSTIRATKKYRLTQTHVFALSCEPSVAVIIASFNEDPIMLEDTIASVTNLEYTNKRVYLLDDSTKQELQKAAEMLAQRYKCIYVHRVNRRGYKAGAINDLLRNLKEKYAAVFDADQKPVSGFLKEIIPLLEENTRLAFVQTPQFYEKAQYSPVALGAFHQQSVFYEYICEGKSTSSATFCCGTNVVFRTEALHSIGGFDETSITEDFATSVRLHYKRWQSLYYNKVCAYGLAPETLAGYFTQQMRWATGTIGTFRGIVKKLLLHPRALSIGQWWEYFLSGSYYFIGWSNFIFIISPIVFIIFGLRPLVTDPLIYTAAFVPYFAVSLGSFYLSMKKRGYRVRDLFLAQSLAFITFYPLMRAAVAATVGKKHTFGVTPKGAGGRIPWRYLSPQLCLLAISLIATSVAIYRLTATLDLAMVVNACWAIYNGSLLAMVFYFNRPFRGYPDAHIFRDWTAD